MKNVFANQQVIITIVTKLVNLANILKIIQAALNAELIDFYIVIQGNVFFLLENVKQINTDD